MQAIKAYSESFFPGQFPVPARLVRLIRERPVRVPVSFYVSLGVAAIFVASSSKFLHWFLIPLILCGTVIGFDAMDWLRGKIKLFDPVGIVGMIGFYFFLLSPLLIVFWNYQMLYLPTQPEDYRTWLGGMGILNLLGLLVYRYTRNISSLPKKTRRPVTRWRIDSPRFAVVLALALALSAALQIWVYQIYGGISGYIDAYKSWVAGQDTFKGRAWLFAVSESFPILAFIGFAVWTRNNKRQQSWLLLAVSLVIFFLLQLLFGGLRGSRSNIVWGLFWAVGIVHLYIRRIPRIIVLLGIPFLFVFMYVYSFYKQMSTDALRVLEGSDAREQLTHELRTSPELVMLSDFARSDVQAFLLYRLLTSPGEYDYALGKTYLGAAALLIPQAFWPDRPPTKLKWTTEAEYGIGAYTGRLHSSRVYGLAGETMLNFGPLLVPFSFCMLGIIVGLVRNLMESVGPFDSRLLLLPFLVNFCFLLLLNDSDIDLFYLLKYGTIPFCVLALGSRQQLVQRGISALERSGRVVAS